MKKLVIFVVGLLFIPLINVKALECYGSKEEDAIDLESISNFACKDIIGDNVTFTSNGQDVSKYFSLNEDKTRINIVDKSLVFAPEFKNGIVVLKDGDKSTIIYVKNKAYITTQKPSTTTTTTTTVKETIKYTVSLDPNDGTEITTKSCAVISDSNICNITLPNIDKDSFNGWGTAKTCKEGKIGTIKVDKDITYYACYKNNVSKTILLKSLTLTDKDTNEEIKFGTFSIKKREYSFKVLNKVQNINVSALANEGINIEVEGNENLTIGENKIVIKLTDKNNNQNEYILDVTRLEEGETLDNINYLKSLVIGGYNINFNKEQLVYNLTISSDIDKLEITAIPEKEEVKKEILNNENLVDGSQILIKLTDENGEFTTYTINISKESSTNYLLFIAIGVIILLIILLIILIIIKSNQKKKQIKNNSNPEVLVDNKKDNIEILNI